MTCQEDVMRIGKKLEMFTSEKSLKNTDDLNLLTTLKRLPMTLEILQKTHIGVIVNSYRKQCKNEECISLAKELVRNWKKLLPVNNDKTASRQRTERSASASTSEDSLYLSKQHFHSVKGSDDQKNEVIPTDNCSGICERQSMIALIGDSTLKTTPINVESHNRREITAKQSSVSKPSIETVRTMTSKNTTHISKPRMSLKTQKVHETNSKEIDKSKNVITTASVAESVTIALCDITSECSRTQVDNSISDLGSELVGVPEVKLNTNKRANSTDKETIRRIRKRQHSVESCSTSVEASLTVVDTKRIKSKIQSNAIVSELPTVIDHNMKQAKDRSHSSKTEINNLKTETENFKTESIQCNERNKLEPKKSISTVKYLSSTVSSKKLNKNREDASQVSDVRHAQETINRDSLPGDSLLIKSSRVSDGRENIKQIKSNNKNNAINNICQKQKYSKSDSHSKKQFAQNATIIDSNSEEKIKMLNERKRDSTKVSSKVKEMKKERLQTKSESTVCHSSVQFDRKDTKIKSETVPSFSLPDRRNVKIKTETISKPIIDDVKPDNKKIKADETIVVKKSHYMSKEHNNETPFTPEHIATSITEALISDDKKYIKKQTSNKILSHSHSTHSDVCKITQGTSKKSFESAPKKQESVKGQFEYQDNSKKSNSDELLAVQKNASLVEMSPSQKSTESSASSIKSTLDNRKEKRNSITGEGSLIDSSKQSSSKTTISDSERSSEAVKTSIKEKEKSNVSGGVRDKCRGMIAAALRSGEPIEGSGDIDVIAIAVEDCIFLEFKTTDMKYSNRVRSRITNLKDAKNPRLRENLLLGHISPSQMAIMTMEEMASDAMKSLRARFTKESIEDHQMDTQSQGKSVLFRCSECGMRDTTYNQVQLLCSDEPMTTFVLCNHCGNRWRFD